MSNKSKLVKFLKEPLVFTKQNFESQNDLFETVYEAALAENLVLSDFITGIKDREKNFPTGIQLEKYGVAIPHTDPEYVKEEFIAVVTSESGVMFSSMEDENVKVNANVVFLLGLNQAHAQLAMLQKLIELFQNDNALKGILTASSYNELVSIINNFE